MRYPLFEEQPIGIEEFLSHELHTYLSFILSSPQQFGQQFLPRSTGTIPVMILIEMIPLLVGFPKLFIIKNGLSTKQQYIQ